MNTTKEKPISARRLKARKLAEVAIQIGVNEQGTLTDIANAMPERFGTHSIPNIRTSVHNRLQSKMVQEEIIALLPTAQKHNIANAAQNRLSEVLNPKQFDAYKAVAPRYVELGLRLDGRLIDQTVIRHEIGNVSIEIVEAAADQFIQDADFEDVVSPGGRETALDTPVESKQETQEGKK